MGGVGLVLVTEATARVPLVAGHPEAQPAVLAEHRGPGGAGHRGAGTHIDMVVHHVAVAAVHRSAAVDPAHVVHQPRRVVRLDLVSHAGLVVLAPALVLVHPHHQGRRTAVLVDDAVVLGLPLGASGGVGGAQIHGGHVLPDQQTEPVGPVEPALRLDLDVLAHHVEAEVLVLLQVVPESGVGGGRVDAVRPVALVQRARLEDELAVQHRAQHTVDAGEADGAHAGVAADGVDRRAGGQQLRLHVVEERIVGRPAACVRDRDGELAADRTGGGADRGTAAGDGHTGLVTAGTGAPHGDLQTVGAQVGHHVESGDVRGRRGLEPHRLPDAGGRGVEDAPTRMGRHLVDPLFPDRLATGLGGIPHGDDHGVRAAVQQVGDVVGEGVEAAAVGGPGLPVVDPHGRAPVTGAEVELHAAAVPVRRDREGALVPELVVLGDPPLDAGERGLGDERHPDLLGERGGPPGVRRGDGEVPDPVEIGPVGPGELRAGVLGQRVVDRDLAGPRGGHRRGLRGPRPGRRGRGAGGGDGEDRACQERQHGQHGGEPPPAPSVPGNGTRWCGRSTHRHSFCSGGGRRARTETAGRARERDRPSGARTRRREVRVARRRVRSFTSAAVCGPATSGRRPRRPGRRR